MGAMNLSVQVQNISPKATEEDLIIFFSYCGTVDKIHLQRDIGDQSQSAFVSFKQPYAFQTALLLNDATVIDRRVSISPVEILTCVPILPCPPKNWDPERSSGGGSFIPAVQATGKKVLAKSRDLVSDAGKILTHQTNTAISSAEHTVGSIGSASSTRISKSTIWLSDVFDKASKGVAVLGNAKEERNPNSRKRK